MLWNGGLVLAIGAVFWFTVDVSAEGAWILQTGHLLAYLMVLSIIRHRYGRFFVIFGITLSGWVLGLTQEPFIVAAWTLYQASLDSALRRRLVPLAALVAALFLMPVLGVHTASGREVLLRAMVSLTFLLGAWLLGVQGGAEAAQRDRETRARELTGLFEERARLSRELHDVLSHTLSRIGLHAGVAAETSDDPAGRETRALREIEASSGQALAEVREALMAVRTGAGGGEGLVVEDLSALIRRGRESGIEVTAEIDLPGGALFPTNRHLYRIVQELVTNIGRHASATRGTLRMGLEGDRLLVRSENVASEPGPRPAQGLGLLGLRERVRLLGGECDVVALSGAFIVEVSLPLPAEARHEETGCRAGGAVRDHRDDRRG
ncbi:sensor histidine kinase [Rothia halotolerans]|uniref:sensor histidine kinase n=1 Tax=Rothia halotolerans TaxID=405770 RepID=UPI00101C2331|nr:histidine kinase [Rothia halotolerans]